MDRKLAVRPLVASLMLSLLAACVSTDPSGDNAAATADAAAASASADGGSASASASASASSSMVSNATGAALDTVLAGDWRTPKWVARDQYRHPKETLSFFLLKPDQTVIEITPGGGWYTELLAPYLRDNGQYVAAVWDDEITGQPEYRYNLNKQLREKIAGNADVYGKTEGAHLRREEARLRPAELRRRRADLPQRPQLGGRRQCGGLLQRVLRRAQAGRHAGLRRPSREGGHRPADADQERLPHRRTGEEVRAGRRLRARRRRARSTRIRRTPPITRTACGRCRRATSTTRPTMRSTRRSAKAIA